MRQNLSGPRTSDGLSLIASQRQSIYTKGIWKKAGGSQGSHSLVHIAWKHFLDLVRESLQQLPADNKWHRFREHCALNSYQKACMKSGICHIYQVVQTC